MAKVLVGMSGGVDSAVAAYLLKKEGYEVVGITLRTWEAVDGQENRCCEIDEAREIAYKLDIPFYAPNCVEEFEKEVIKPFINDYVNGLTPNPCTVCNRYVKWEKMLYMAEVLGADYIATGHYASVVKLDNGRYTVKKASHLQKDQTYMLYQLTQEQLSKTLMPLGPYDKAKVRRIAKDLDLIVANKPDSQEICFVTKGDYADYILENATCTIKGSGNFVDEDGNILGKHKGIIHYTVGQRKGLGLALGYPAYVKEIRADKNEVVIGKESSLYSTEMICRDVNFLKIEKLDKDETIRATVKIRYHHEGEKATLKMLDDGNLKVVFDNKVRAITPGQATVFYDESDMVIGGGVIVK